MNSLESGLVVPVVNPYATRADVPGFMRTIDTMKTINTSLQIQDFVRIDDPLYKQRIYGYINDARREGQVAIFINTSGDGGLNRLVNQLHGILGPRDTTSCVAIAHIPSGGFNVPKQFIGLPMEAGSIVKALQRGHIMYLDHEKAVLDSENDQFTVLALLSTGFIGSPVVSRYYEQQRKTANGSFRPSRAFVQGLHMGVREIRPTHVTACTEGNIVFDEKAAFIELFKYQKAAYFVVAPGMSPTDGHMMMTMVPAESVRGGFVRVALGLGVLGRLEHNPLVDRWNITEARFTFDRPTPWHVDGEPGDIKIIQASLSCVPRSVPFVTPISASALHL